MGGVFVRPEAITIGAPPFRPIPASPLMKKRIICPIISHQRETTKLIASGASRRGEVKAQGICPHPGPVHRPMPIIPSVTLLQGRQGDLTAWGRFKACDSNITKMSNVLPSDVEAISHAVPDGHLSLVKGHARSDTTSSDESSGRSSNASGNSTHSHSASIDGSLLCSSLNTQGSDDVREELAQLVLQAKKLRSSVARRRTHAGANCRTDKVEGILMHYEKYLADTETRIELLRRTLRLAGVA